MKSLLIIFIGAILVLFTGLGKKENRSSILAMGILLLALVFAVLDFGGWAKWDFELKYVPQEMMFFNRISLAFVVILIMAAIFILGLFRQKETVGSDLIGLLMFSLCGGIIMAAFNHLVMLFIGMEALSIPLYVLAASKKSSLKSNEAAIKYFLMGAFSSAVFLLGCAFVYGATGGLDMVSLYFAAEKLVHMGAVSSLLTIGVSLIMIGLCFKVSAVPFHFWSPDVYEGSPNRATVFMSTVVKIAAFAAFFRLLSLVLFELKAVNWGLILAVISAITIVVGNVGALAQKSVKRTLAYSSIAHAGYMMMAVVSNSETMGQFMFPLKGLHALLIYSAAYVFANVIIFYYFNKVSSEGDESFEAFSGLAKNNRFAAVMIALSMFSLAGIPVTAGFAGKYMLLTSAFNDYAWLVLVALIGSAISIGFYFRIFKNIFFTEGSAQVSIHKGESSLILIAGLGILIIGMAPWLITKLNYLVFP
jgi:NADH-quinone oxidoreductase subunit N